MRVPPDEAPRFEALLDILRAEIERPPGPESAELRRHLLTSVLLWAQRWREAQLEGRGATGADVELHRRFQELLERDFATSHEAGHYADELGTTTGTLSRLLTRLTGRSTKQLITDRVTLEAARLLRFSDLSIKEIAARLGFSGPVRLLKGLQAPARGGPARLSGTFDLPLRYGPSCDRGARRRRSSCPCSQPLPPAPRALRTSTTTTSCCPRPTAPRSSR